MADNGMNEPDTIATMFDDQPSPSDDELEATGGTVTTPPDPAEEPVSLDDSETEQAEKAAEKLAEKKEEVEEPEKKQTTVPYGALAEERERRKALEAEQQKNRELMARMEERFKALQDKLTPKEPEPKVPSYEDDPAEHLKSRLDRVEGLTREQIDARQQAEAQRVQAQELAQFQQVVSSKEHEFAQQRPDYFEAVQSLRENQVNEMVATGYDKTQAEQIINQYAFEIAARNMQAGKNPAEAFYQLAKLRGYSPKGEGEVEKLKTVSQGIQRTASLGPSGETTRTELSLQDLASMSDDDFAKATTGSNWAKLWH